MFGCLFAYYLGSAGKCPVDMATYVLAPDEFLPHPLLRPRAVWHKLNEFTVFVEM